MSLGWGGAAVRHEQRLKASRLAAAIPKAVARRRGALSATLFSGLSRYES